MAVFRLVTAAIISIVFGIAPAFAQDAGAQFQLELNNAAPTDGGGCRLTYVATNQSDQALTETA